MNEPLKEQIRWIPKGQAVVPIHDCRLMLSFRAGAPPTFKVEKIEDKKGE